MGIFSDFNIQALFLPYEQVIDCSQIIYEYIYIFHCKKIKMEGPCPTGNTMRNQF